MDILDGRTVVAIGNHEVMPALDEVNAEITRLQAVRLQLIARAETDGLAQELGARDTIELLTFRHRRDRTEAWRDVHLARALPKYKAVNAALTHGIQSTDGTVHQMQTGHAAAIITELERVRTRVPVETLDVAEEQLVGLTSHLTPKELRTAAKQLCDRIDADGPEPEEHKANARESLTLSTAENGVKFRGYLANENAELLRAIVHAGARPHKTVDGEHDPRPRDKRQADALTTALTVAANAWDTDTAGHGAKANITVTIDLDDLRSATATAHATGQTVYGDDLSAGSIRRLACDANVIPLVLGSNSEPLDVGRSERLVTRHIRHALVARDRGCVVCAAPPVMCDAHHLTHWVDGGPTAVDNLALLCRRHHVDLHNDRWAIAITDGKVHVARPTWADPTPARPTQPPRPAPAHPNSPPREPQRDTPTTPVPPLAAPAHPEPAGAAPAYPDSPGVVPACPEPAGVVAACSDLPGPVPTCAGDPPPTLNPWGDTAPRTSRWTADEATLTAATHFAVWGNRTPTEPATGPPFPPPSEPSASDRATRHQPVERGAPNTRVRQIPHASNRPGNLTDPAPPHPQRAQPTPGTTDPRPPHGPAAGKPTKRPSPPRPASPSGATAPRPSPPPVHRRS
ncbi:DUF222 domain-containing protein [Kribbella sp. NPDC059898]|uniref:HNH endonuclease n=1 Tax=Kribbella sp. NPDC059898 TaxID=3346995 RepID=UPI0036486D89